MFRRIHHLVCPLLIAVAFALSACDEQSKGDDSNGLPIISVGDAELRMELALTRDEQTRGLMHRESIASDHGMLFVFPEPQAMSFWMKNVNFPIDIGYFTGDGVLREVYRMYAHDTQSRKSKRDDLVYVLEVEAGWFKKNEVRPGDQLDLEAVRQAIAQRR